MTTIGSGSTETKKRKRSDDISLKPYENKPEKVNHNVLFATHVREFLDSHLTNDMHYTTIYLDADNAKTTLALAKFLTTEQMKKVCANTIKEETYKKMKKTIKDNKIECHIDCEDIWRKVHGKVGINNQGKPICIYLDGCSMWTKNIKKIVNNSFRWYSFDGSYLALTVCLTKRKPKYPSDPKVVLKEINSMAEKYGRTTKIIHQTVYGRKNMEMFFVLFRVE
jgi:hypothetical protein